LDTTPDTSFHSYWTPERKETFRQAYSDGKSHKQMVLDHFKELSPKKMENHAAILRRKMGLPRKQRGGEADHNFRAYWTPEKKELLKQAHKAGRPFEEIHDTHFSDISFPQFRHALIAHKEELGLNNRPRGGVKFAINRPLDPSIRDRIRSMLGSKQPKSQSDIAKDIEVGKSSVSRESVKLNGPKFNRIKSDSIPQEHIDYASDLLGKDHYVPSFGRQSKHGPVTIARALNTKFGSKYTRSQIHYLIKNGHISTKKETQVSEEYLNERELVRKALEILSLARKRKNSQDGSGTSESTPTSKAVTTRSPKTGKPRTFHDERPHAEVWASAHGDPNHSPEENDEAHQNFMHTTLKAAENHLNSARDLHSVLGQVSSLLSRHMDNHGSSMPEEHALIISRLAQAVNGAGKKLTRSATPFKRTNAAVVQDAVPVTTKGVNAKRIGPPAGPYKGKAPKTATSKVNRKDLHKPYDPRED
jgi:hypothetical protein